MDISELLAFSVKNKASDLHLSAGLPPMIRVHGDVRRINLPPLEHKDVHGMIYDIMAFDLDAVEGLQGDADDGETPDHAEQRPTKRPVQRTERKRRVGSSNQQKDCAVIEYTKDSFGTVVGNRMQLVAAALAAADKQHGAGKDQ